MYRYSYDGIRGTCRFFECGSSTIFDQRINTPAAYITNRHSSLRIDMHALPALPAMLVVYNHFWMCYRHIMNRTGSAFCPVIDIATGGWIQGAEKIAT